MPDIRIWPVYAAELQRSFVDILTPEEAAAIRDALSQVHAHARPATVTPTR